MKFRAVVLISAAVAAGPATAGVHYSGENWAELPAQWRGFLLDHRAMRSLALPDNALLAPAPLRDLYRAERQKLATLARPLTADESADLGALHIRLGEADKAVAVLRAGHSAHPDHFRCASNLATACQLVGEWDLAVAAAEAAVRLAPARWRRAEQAQLRLIRQRRAEPRGAATLDDLFGVKFTGESAVPAGLPGDAIAVAQTLCLWLPGDGRLLWQVGELARATGDTAIAAAVLEGCVTEYGLGDATLRRRRQDYRADANALAAKPPARDEAAHAAHNPGGLVRFKSPRPLVRDSSRFPLPPVRPDGVNAVPWFVLSDTILDKPFRVTFHPHLKQLDGRRVVMTGFIQPTGEGLEQLAVLLIEYPVGCWFCEIPEPTGIVLVEPPAGQVVQLTREAVRIEGRLKLNARDPEEFIYTIVDARVGPPE
jgi:tetratricopeptide (TPR) repeat protein